MGEMYEEKDNKKESGQYCRGVVAASMCKCMGAEGGRCYGGKHKQTPSEEKK